MVTVEEAKKILIENTFRSDKTCKKKIKDSIDHFLAEDIFSPIDLPPFNQSNVDGYAVRLSDQFSWKVTAEIKAGDSPGIKLRKGEAARIFTGAVVPDNADAVIMQENVSVKKNRVSVNAEKLSGIIKGQFIRNKGSHIKRGEHALSKDTFITPAVAGFISGMGINKVNVFTTPKVTLIITGNELLTPGRKLKKGKVFDSNSFILESALNRMNIKPVNTIFVKDRKEKMKKIISECIYGAVQKSDVILISGGVSVGKYDFVNEIMEEIGTVKLFYKVSQRPGKPLYFGMNEGTYIFGLPGNPASALTCFYEYVYPHLRKLMGYEKYFLCNKMVPVLKDLNKNFKLSNFLKAKLQAAGVEPLDGQASYILKTLAEADCFIYMGLETESVKAGEDVEVHLFPLN